MVIVFRSDMTLSSPDDWLSCFVVDRKRVNTTSIDLGCEYPHHWTNTSGVIKHWCFVLPINRTTTRGLLYRLFEHIAVKIPLAHPLLAMLAKIATVLTLKPLMREDGAVLAEEQAGYEVNFAAPIIELNPAVHLLQDLVIHKWQEFVTRQQKVPELR